MKRSFLVIALAAIIPILSGCGISKSFTIYKDRPCGCHGSKHHHSCSYGYKHRPPNHHGSHDSHPDHGHDFQGPRVTSNAIVNLNHRPVPNYAKAPRPTPKAQTRTQSRPQPSRTNQVSRTSPNRAVRSDSKPTKPNKVKAAKKHGR